MLVSNALFTLIGTSVAMGGDSDMQSGSISNFYICL